jgi:hypothetical protein
MRRLSCLAYETRTLLPDGSFLACDQISALDVRYSKIIGLRDLHRVCSAGSTGGRVVARMASESNTAPGGYTERTATNRAVAPASGDACRSGSSRAPPGG